MRVSVTVIPESSSSIADWGAAVLVVVKEVSLMLLLLSCEFNVTEEFVERDSPLSLESTVVFILSGDDELVACDSSVGELLRTLEPLPC